jgi:hypothetical protein
MSSNINPNNIDREFPVAGQDNDSQGFRDNFTSIKNNFSFAAAEITDLQNSVTSIQSTVLANGNVEAYYGNISQGLSVHGTTHLVDNVTVDADITVAGNIYGNFAGNIAGNITGDIYTASGIRVLDNGTTLANPTFFGDIYASNGANIVLNNGTNGTDAVFYGTVQGTLSGNISGTTYTDDIIASSVEAVTLRGNIDGSPTVTGDLTVSGNLIINGSIAEASYQFVQSPISGQGVIVNTSVTKVILNPTANLSAITTQLPGGQRDGTVVAVHTTKWITNFSANSAVGTVTVNPDLTTALTPLAAATYLWRESDNTWYRIGS